MAIVIGVTITKTFSVAASWCPAGTAVTLAISVALSRFTASIAVAKSATTKILKRFFLSVAFMETTRIPTVVVHNNFWTFRTNFGIIAQKIINFDLRYIGQTRL